MQKISECKITNLSKGKSGGVAKERGYIVDKVDVGNRCGGGDQIWMR